MMTRKEQYEVINYDFYQDFDKNIARRKLKKLKQIMDALKTPLQ